MSFESLAVVMNHSRANGADRLVLIGIASHEGDGGAFPGIAKLARYAGIEERSVKRCLRRLEALGEVATYVQAGGSSGVPDWRRPNRYVVLLECPAHCDKTRNHKLTPLPTTASDLWIKGVTHESPGDPTVTGGVTHESPEGVTGRSPELPKETPTNPGSVNEVTTDRARSCSVCLRSEDDCRSRVATSGHEFTPRAA